MRYLAASVHQPPADRNPMHQFVVGHGDYEVSRLLYRDQYADAEHALLFHVGGPRDPYERALARQGSVREFELSSCPDDSFYVYVRAATTGRDREFADAFSQPGLIVITPIEYCADGTVRLTAVGPAETIQKAVEAVPGTMGVEVGAVGEFFAGRRSASQLVRGPTVRAGLGAGSVVPSAVPTPDQPVVPPLLGTLFVAARSADCPQKDCQCSHTHRFAPVAPRGSPAEMSRLQLPGLPVGARPPAGRRHRRLRLGLSTPL